METPIKSIDLLSHLNKKEISLSSLSNSNKENYIKYRTGLIQEIKELSFNELIINYEEVFYLTVTYIDHIFIQYDNIKISNKTIRENFSVSCLSLAIKMIGWIKRDIFKMVPFSDKTLNEYEGYCLQMLNYNLVYTTPYDYISMIFGSNINLFESAKNLLSSFVFNSLYLDYSYFSIAMGIINHSIDITTGQKFYLVDYDKWIHSSESEELKHILKK